MADYRTRVSFMIPLTTDEQRAWAEDAVAAIAAQQEGEEREYPAFLESPANEENVDYSVEVQDDGLWVYDDDGCTPEDIVPLVQDYLARFDPEGALGFEWANTCSRPITGAFGGGAVFITATDEEWMACGNWLASKVIDHKKKG